MARQSRRDTIIAVIARMRVALGFVSGVLVLILSRPSARSLALGMSIAAVGEAIRIWAAGHLHKSREVTASGPYRFVGHPLYVGSSVMGVGLAIACSSLVVAALIALYLVTTLTAAVKSEEAYLRRTFGEQYDLYRSGVAAKRREPSAAQARISTPSGPGRKYLATNPRAPVLRLFFPVEHAFFQGVDVAHHQDRDEAQHTPENDLAMNHSFAKYHRPRIHVDDFEIEEDEEHRNEIELHAKARLPLTLR